jgi:VCBS repeat-containing protein
MNVTGSWFTISCASTGSHTAVVSGGPQNFTLNPDIDFAYNELCTVTIFASQVSDQDTNDPPDTLTADYVFSFTTFELLVCGSPATPIHNVQGSGAQSPLANGTVVTIEGVVVGDYQGTGQFGGYHLQEEDADADADPATSEGIFIFNSTFPVSPGDKVAIKGTVFEFFSSGTPLTELNNIRGGGLCSSGNSVTPTEVTLPVSSVSDWERYEGMLIHISQDLTVSETFNLGRFGEVSLSVNGRLRNPTNIVAPGAPAAAQQDLNNRSMFVLDDGNNQQNIDPTIYPVGGLDATNTLRSGYTVHGITGVLEQRFADYRIQPVGAIDFDSSTNPRALPESIEGSLRVAALNVLNYFTTLDTAPGLCGPTGGLDCRGANSAFELTRQRDKMVNAILTIDPDVAGLMEVQNDATTTTQNIVDGLNAVAGAGTYAYINTGTIGTDAIKVAIIYKPATVTPLGSFAILDSSVDPLFIDTKNRPSLAQTFQQTASGEKFTIVVNHLKSKGSDCNDVGDPDIGDGQGNCNVTRTKAATALVNWLATDPTSSGDPDFLVVGDMNSYAKEDPITTIKNGGYTNLLETLIGPDAYSYVFDGQSGYLDHALASASLVSQVSGVTEWHNNADEPTVMDYNVEFKTANQINTFYTSQPYRASDHDPVIVGMNLNAPSVAVDDSYTTNEDTTLNVAAPGVLGNDTDANNNTLTAVLVSSTMHGTLTLNPDGSFSYAPAANYNGADSFTYKANDGSADSNIATVNITVTALNDAPTATNDSYSTNEDTALTAPAPGVLSNDSDVENNSLTAVLVSGPSHGTLTLNANGSFTYTPASNYNGSDSFTYKANDGNADSSVVTVSITVNAVNDVPLAANNSYSTNEDVTLSVTAPGVLANDSDVDGNSLTAVLVTGPSHGSLTLNSNGSFSYAPASNYNGSDSFTYKANDGLVDSNTATVTITINPVNDNPVAGNDSVTVAKNSSIAISVLLNDTDIDGDTLTVTSWTQPTHGTITYSAKNKNFRYTPTKGFTGADSFTYTISDGHGGTSTATVSITVN